MVIADLKIGQIFGYLTLVSETTKTGSNGCIRKAWNVLCICGNTRIITATHLVRKAYPSKSCGCRGGDWSKSGNGSRKPFGVAAFNRYLESYKTNTKRRNSKFELTVDEFKNLIYQNCHYCNAPPSLKYGDKKFNGFIIVNGIDRMNNNIGYVIDNCVSCCSACNYLKNAIAYDVFLNKIKSIYEHLNLKK